jgi:hypothetical protein
MPVTYVIRNGKAIFQGDIVLERLETPDPRHPFHASIGIAYGQYLWPKVGSTYQIPYVIAASSADLANLNVAITQFNSTFSNIQFVARTAETDYVNFNFNGSDLSGVCDAIIGRTGGEQTVGGSGACTVATILHEMGHTVGLWHEQSRSDRDTFVSVNYNNLIKGSISNFNKVYDDAQLLTLYDYASIMEYPALSFSRNGGTAIESIPAGIPLSNQTGYTAADIDGIERLYNSAPTAVTVATNPPGLQVIVDGVTMTTPQVFNWTLGSSHTLNVPSGVQSQAGNIVNSNTATTFYYTYGRWNDSTSASHTITVTPGNGFLASPASSPAVTTYTANFIQLVPYAATVFPTGTGTVTPSPAPQTYTGSALSFFVARQQVSLTATPNAGQNFYEFNNSPFWLPGGLGANPKTFYVPDTGLTVNTTAEFSPNPVYTITTNPNGFSSNIGIFADGNFWYAPKSFSAFYDSTWTAGSSHTLTFTSPTYPWSSNTRFAFLNWSDGTGTTTDSVTLPATSTTYTANLTPQYFLTDYVNESCAGSINVSPGSPTSDGFYPSGDLLTFTQTPAAGWTFTGWQYDLGGTTSPQMLTVNDETLVTADYNTISTPLALTSLSPASTVAGTAGFTLTLNGTGFTPSTLVAVNGTFATVTYVNSTQIKVPVISAQVAQAGAFQVWAENFPSGATCSAFVALPFMVANASGGTVVPSVSSLKFAARVLGTAGTAQLTLRNTGTNSVAINSIATTPDFSQSNTCGSSLAAGATCTVTVSYTPIISGATTGVLTITDGAPNSPQIVNLSGSGVLPLTVAPAKLTFGTVTVGSTSAAQKITLTNNAASTLSLSATPSANYAITSNGTTCGATLASKAKCTIAVTFTPTANGSVNGSLNLADGTAYAQFVQLSGTGSGAGTSPLSFSPATLTFTTQAVGTTSAAKSIMVTNSSGSAITLNSLGATNGFTVAGGSGSPCSAGLNLAAGASCSLSVTFAPTLGTVGAISGGITITDTAAIGTQVIDVKGTAALPLTIAPASLAFPAQTVGTSSAPKTLTLTNNLATALPITIAGSGDFAATPGSTTPCGASLAAHAKCTVNVTFTPTATGTRSGTVGITDSGNPGAQTVTATGTGQ